MILYTRLLLLLFAAYHPLVVTMVEGDKGKGLGERCFRFNECGDYPRSFIICHNQVCKCPPDMYYEPKREMCVSYVGGKCDAAEPTDAVQLEIKCGENADCSPLPYEKFGRCRCKFGFRETDKKCVHTISSRLSGNVPSSVASHPNHPKFGEPDSLGSKHGNVLVPANEQDSFRGPVSFPFESSSSLQSSRSTGGGSTNHQSYSWQSHWLLLVFLTFFPWTRILFLR